jgi:SAM-dependent methyltransferase
MAARALGHLAQYGATFARRAVMVATLRSSLRRDPTRRLKALYRWRDPWDMASEREQYRFRATNRLLADIYGPIDGLLEIGCGEGHHSRHLTDVCVRLTGIDVSPRATSRASERVPEASFVAGKVDEQPWADTAGQFDVAVACEVLYYVDDVGGLLDQLEHISRRGVFVTCYDEGMELVADALRTRTGVERASFRYEQQVWEAAWWAPPAR